MREKLEKMAGNKKGAETGSGSYRRNRMSDNEKEYVCLPLEGQHHEKL